MKTINLLGYTCYLETETYLSTEGLCITACDVEDHSPVAVITTNISEHWQEIWKGTPDEKQYPQAPLIVIKDYSENEGVADALVEQGVITGHFRLANCNGMFKLARLTDEWIKELNLNN